MPKNILLWNWSCPKEHAAWRRGALAHPAKKRLSSLVKKAGHYLPASQYSRSLIEASLDPLVTISAEGKITDVNMATEQVTGVMRTGLVGSDFADYFTDPAQARKGCRQVFANGFVTDYPLACCFALSCVCTACGFAPERK